MNGHVKVIEENDNYAILKPLTIEGLCTYYNSTSWCDTSGYGKRDFTGFVNEGGVIYIFHNKRNNQKSIFARTRYNEIVDEDFNRMSLYKVQGILSDRFGIKSGVTRELLGSNIFNNLRKFLRGQMSENVLESCDPLIYDIRKKGGEYYIKLDMSSDDKFLEMLGLTEDDISVYWGVNSSYGNWTFRDSDSDYEEMREGYGPFSYMNLENTKKLEKIASFFMPSRKHDGPENEYYAELFKLLYEEFPRKMDEIIYSYNDETNQKTVEYARESINKEISDYLKEKNINVGTDFQYPEFKLVDILDIYSQMGKSKYSLSEILEDYNMGSKDKLGGWYDNMYDFEAGAKIDYEYLNNEWGKQLDDILDNLEEVKQENKEYYDLYDRITNKFTMNKEYFLPKDKNVTYKIRDIDRETLKIKVDIYVKQKLSGVKRHEFSEENFYKFLYQPELFKLY